MKETKIFIGSHEIQSVIKSNIEQQTIVKNNLTWIKGDSLKYVTAIKTLGKGYAIIPHVIKNGYKTRLVSDGWTNESMVFGSRFGPKNKEYNICATGVSDGAVYRVGTGNNYSRLNGTSNAAKDVTWTADSSMSSNTQYPYIFMANTNNSPIGNGYQGNIYLIQIWNSSNQLIYDLRPVLKNNVACFINEVDGTFIYAESGSFVAVE